MPTTTLNHHERLRALTDLLTPSIIRAAATLRLADRIAAGVNRTDALAEVTGTVPELLDMLLRRLAGLELLSRAEDGAYTVAPLGELLLDTDPSGIRGLLSMDGLFGRQELALVNVLHTVRTGQPSHAAVFGAGYWEDINHNPDFVDALELNAHNPIGWDASIIVEGYDWSSVRSVTDVGGHSGALLIELLRSHPHLNGRLLDLKNVAEVGGRAIAAAGLADRAEAVVGSFFEPLPTGTDVYLLSAILADWDDEQAITILRHCGEAAGPGGKVLLAEVNLPVAETGSLETAGFELYLRATMPAPVRSVEQLERLGEAAGLRVSRRGPVTPVRSLLEFTLA
jgi:hypothetical protein